MNYLFNLYLIQQLISREEILGVIIAGYIKYSPKKEYDTSIEDGIRYQTMMEAFIKNHPSFNKSKKRIDPRYSRFSNEIVKIYYSHFLASYWEEYSKVDLSVTVNKIYIDLVEGWECAPKKLKKLIPILTAPSGIPGMRTIGGIHSFIEEGSRHGICVRYLQNTLLDLVNNYNGFKEDFESFMKDFERFSKEVRRGDDNLRQSYLLANAS